jgi:hypothetical protein
MFNRFRKEISGGISIGCRNPPWPPFKMGAFGLTMKMKSVFQLQSPSFKHEQDGIAVPHSVNNIKSQ